MQPLKTQRITIKKDIITHLKVCRDELVRADLTSFSGIKQNNQSPYFLASLVFFIAMPISIMGATIDVILAWGLSQDNVIRLIPKYIVRCLVGLIYLSFSILSACLLLVLSTPDLLSSAVDFVYQLLVLIAECVFLPSVYLAVSILTVLGVALAACVYTLSFFFYTLLFPLIFGSPFLAAAYFINTKFILAGIPVALLAMVINIVYMSAETKVPYLLGLSALAVVGIPVVAALVLGFALPLVFAILFLGAVLGGVGAILTRPSILFKCSLAELQLDLSNISAVKALKESFVFEMCVGIFVSKPSHKVPMIHSVHQPLELKDLYCASPLKILGETIYNLAYQPVKSATLITCSYPNNDNIDDVPNKGGL